MSNRYDELMERRGPILRRALGIDYEAFECGPIEFDYEGLLAASGLTAHDVARIQHARGVGRTPMLELHSVTELVRSASEPGMGARIFVKDEAANPSGSFKDRRAALSAHFAAERGYAGIVAATSGNYGAAVASQAAQSGLNSIIVQEAFDSRGVGQPEIVEKARKCEALGAEVLQTTVGPELFYMLLSVLEETGYFNASLYTPMSIQGIETLGTEIVEDIRAITGREPSLILATHAGGGMCTGVARGVHSAEAATQVVGVSVDLSGLHMASDNQFNRKSFTTGHTGFSMPFTAWPDRVDVPRNAARSLRYLDRFVTVTQGSVFYATEVLAQLEGLERGPAGNTSLAAALAIARELPADEVVVISETEYTGAGKTPWAQLEFAESLGVEVVAGSGSGVPGESIVLPTRVADVTVTDVRLDRLRASYLRTVQGVVERPLTPSEISFVAEDCNTSVDEVSAMIACERSA
ncbi:2-amino-4-oxopentanoate thiolase subunit OrtB [Streptomyces sp. NPDC002346]